MARIQQILLTLKHNPLRWLVFIVLFALIYYASLLLSLMISFGNPPNYYRVYDWFGNVAEIIRATPSAADAYAIIKQEWALEIGFMNYEYGFGISEWSLNILPFKVLSVLLLALLLVLNWRLLRQARQNSVCSLPEQKSPGTKSLRVASAATGLGAVLVSMASMTMFWVVCCATPSWVVGLAMLGLVSASTALFLDPYEGVVLWSGFILLALSAWLLSGVVVRQTQVDNRPTAIPALSNGKPLGEA
ncbi:hypothetical protein OLMES_3949 [Oleiphilus messinensis]|uniref:Uncharacterized protein n=1 Tax=Oleiphilus messinensis TaxID=141451 RepID=A0A1Y0IBR8_9GAMM|nr:hypothetical protein [Oleiphilus messinensis]ARU57968.1 hypothetical protein OLMES_3949 [Oleiphilus messinensis]